ncbi:MAG TPA: enoyl-CoA hydratase/isomerase family protein [Acidimicrobiia bacterium]|nr:enoyl-CoA hydratase/isomerase family protein [Acidimicrobiia bacterium]
MDRLMINRKQVSDSVTVVQFDHGPVSALDLEFLLALRAELAELADNDAALVLTGTGPAFSAGVDLFRILDGGVDYVAHFIPALSGAFEDIFAYRRPVVAAVNGHAIAGGCVIAACADHRIMADGRGRIGVPELLVGVAFPASALAAVRYATGDVGVADLVYSGVTLLPAEAQQRGLVDEVVPEAELLDRAIAKAEQLASIPAATFAHTKRSLRDRYWTEMEETGRHRDAEMLEVWKSPETRAAIAAYVETTIRKK